MGVPGLRQWILKTFGVKSSLGKIRNLYQSGPHTHFQFGSFSTTVDYLYLDANGLLHNAAQKVFAYGAFEGRGAEETLYNEGYAMERIYELFYENILRVLDIVKVKKVLVIAIDGPAPRAKMNQQRQRRFDVTKTYTNQNISFTSNVITPGTEFMANLTRYVNLQIRKLLNGGAGFQVVFSPVTEPGEGEHKIMDYVRSLPSSEVKENVRHCFFGPDADLIMLALSSHLPNIFLLGEDQFESGYYFFFDMGHVRATLTSKISVPSTIPKNKIADDFVMMGFFVGNDFLPRIQMFHMLPDGLKLMIQTYAALVKDNPRFTLVQNKNLSLEGFRAFVNKLSGNEPNFLIEQVTTKDPKKQPPGEKYVNNTIIRNVAHGLHGSTLRLKSLKKDYYAKSGIVVGENGKGEEEIDQMCADYMKTLSWIHKYYTYGIPAWQWSYAHHYAPLMYDLNEYLIKITPKKFEDLQVFEKGEPLLPFEQLLGVLPPSSKTFLPLEYQTLFEEGLLVEKGYFPSEIKHDYEGKLKEHEAVFLVPFTDPNVLRQAYESVKSQRAYSRNASDYASTYQYDRTYSRSYTSDFGNMPSLHVKRTKKMCSALTIPTYHEPGYVNNLKNNVAKLFVGTIPDLTRFFEGDLEGFRRELKKYKKRDWEPRSKSDEIKVMIPSDMLHKDLRILDFGAGNGKVLESISQSLDLKKENVIAYDLKQVPSSEYYSVVKNLSNLADHSMDCVILFEVLHHISPKFHQDIAKTILSKLKKGGIVIVKEHDFIDYEFWLNYLNLIHEMWYVYQNEKPDVLYPIPNTFERIMELFGGKCLKVDAYTEGNYQRIFKVCLKID